MFVWFALVGTLSRLNVATLLSRPGIGVAGDDGYAGDTGVLPRSFKELTLCSGVWTAK